LALRRGAQGFEQPHAGGLGGGDILYVIAPLTWVRRPGAFLGFGAVRPPLFAAWLVLCHCGITGLGYPARATKNAIAGSLERVCGQPPRRSRVRSRTPHDHATGGEGLPIPRVAYPGLVVGLALFIALLAAHGASDVAAALRTAGIGLLAVAAFHLLPMLADA